MTKILLSAVFLLGWAASPSFAQPTRLNSGQLVGIDFPATEEPLLLSGDRGFFIDAPEEAVRLVVNLITVPSEANIDLFVRFGEEPGEGPNGSVIAGFRSEGVSGEERIEVTQATSPAVMPGRYFIATRTGFGTPATTGFLIATLELASGPDESIVVASSDFEGGDLDGWTRNFPLPDPLIEGALEGDPGSELLSRRRAGPPENRLLELTVQGRNDFFVAARKFLGNWALLGENVRFEFDLRYDGPMPAENNVEVRLLGARSTWAWDSNRRPTNVLERHSVTLDSPNWNRIGGIASLEEVLRDVQRVAIRASYSSQVSAASLDNVSLRGQVSPPRAPLVSTFEEDLGGWTRNRFDVPSLIPRIFGATEGDNATGIQRVNTGGNPGGYLRVSDRGAGARDFLIAPSIFLGNFAALGPDARIEVDRRSQTGRPLTREFEIRLMGFGSVFRHRAAPPGPDWTRYSVELRPEMWTHMAGPASFEDTLRAVQRIEVSVDEAQGQEIAGMDNFSLVAPSLAGRQISLAPEQLRFVAVEGEGAPAAQVVEITSEESGVPWTASSSVPWISIAPDEGTTPAMAAVEVDPAGLGRGVQEGAIAVAQIGSAESPITVEVLLTIVSPTAPLLSRGGVVNSADFTPNSGPGGELTGGLFVSAFGRRLAAERCTAGTVPFPQELGGTSVLVDGIPAPMVFVSPLELVFVLPQAVAGPSAEVVVESGGEQSPAETVRVAPVRPVLFSQDRTGSGPGAIQNVRGDGSVELNTPDSPARPGQAVTVFGAGFGPTETPVADGHPATGVNPVTGDVEVRIGGIAHEPLFTGLSPDSAHLYQSNVVVDADVAPGCAVPLSLLIDGVESNTVTLAIALEGQGCN